MTRHLLQPETEATSLDGTEGHCAEPFTERRVLLTRRQCKPPFLTPPLLPVRNQRYTAGVFALSDSRRMYISRGVGHLMQVRFNVRPEVTVFELQRA